MTEIIPANLSHAGQLASDMREQDAIEVAAMGFSPYEAVFRSIMLSGGESWTLLINGHVAAVGGVMAYGLLQRAGVPWILTGKAVNRSPKEFWRISRLAVGVIRKRYSYLTNIVDSRYTTSIRWLKRLGFEVNTENEVVIGEVPFYRVTWRGA